MTGRGIVPSGCRCHEEGEALKVSWEDVEFQGCCRLKERGGERETFLFRDDLTSPRNKKLLCTRLCPKKSRGVRLREFSFHRRAAEDMHARQKQARGG